MLLWLILPFYDFCCFWSVTDNTVYKLQFFKNILIAVVTSFDWMYSVILYVLTVICEK